MTELNSNYSEWDQMSENLTFSEIWLFWGYATVSKFIKKIKDKSYLFQKPILSLHEITMYIVGNTLRL